MLKEAYLHPAVPDYRVTSINSSRYEPPRGYVHENNEPVYVDSDWDGDELLGLDPAAYESDEHVLVEILDPGHTRASRTMGRIERRPIQPRLDANNESDPDDEVAYYVRVFTAYIESFAQHNWTPSLSTRTTRFGLTSFLLITV